MSIATSIAGLKKLWRTGASLGLGTMDTARFSLSWYMRSPLVSAFAPSFFDVRLPGGQRALLRPNGVDRSTLNDIFGLRLYETDALNVHRVLDLGSNVGLATLFFSSRFPHAEFACVEPFKGNVAILRELIRRNGINASVFEGAIGIAAGECELFVGCEPDMFSLTPGVAAGNTIRVQQFSVTDILGAMNWDQVDLLKIDIEGYEKILLNRENEWLRCVRTVVGEAHGHVGYGIEGVRADLEPLGFEVSLKSYQEEFGLTIFEARNRSPVRRS